MNEQWGVKWDTYKKLYNHYLSAWLIGYFILHKIQIELEYTQMVGRFWYFVNIQICLFSDKNKKQNERIRNKWNMTPLLKDS